MNASENDMGRPYIDKTDNMDLDKGGVKFDAGKIRMDLVPKDATAAIAAVFTYGAIKYDDWNWAKGMRTGRLIAALERHLADYQMGEETDAESGMPHLWHAGCCIMMLISGDARGLLTDDRQDDHGRNRSAMGHVKGMFCRMNDPAGTVKNGGGAIVEDRMEVQAKQVEEMTQAREASASEWMGLTEFEWQVLKSLAPPIPRDVKTFNNVEHGAFERLKANGLVADRHGHVGLTMSGKRYIACKNERDEMVKGEGEI